MAISQRADREPALGPLLLLAFIRLRSLAARFAALAARMEAGTLPKTRPPRPPPLHPRPHHSRPALRLPGSRTWLLRVIGSEAACCGGHLQAFLAEPETQALLAAAPQVGRILRPLCRMLGIRPEPPLALPPRPRKPRPARPKPVREPPLRRCPSRPWRMGSFTLPPNPDAMRRTKPA